MENLIENHLPQSSQNDAPKQSLEQVQQYLRKNYNKGCLCPACGQHVKLYRRLLNSSMAFGAILLYRLHERDGEDQYFQMNREIAKLKIPSTNVEYSKLEYWGMVEQMRNRDNSKKSSGKWRLTNKGRRFVQCRITMPSHVFIYNGKVRGYSKTEININKALGVKFNYAELMSKTWV